MRRQCVSAKTVLRNTEAEQKKKKSPESMNLTPLFKPGSVLSLFSLSSANKQFKDALRRITIKSDVLDQVGVSRLLQHLVFTFHLQSSQHAKKVRGGRRNEMCGWGRSVVAAVVFALFA